MNMSRQYMGFGLRLAFGICVLVAAFQIVDFHTVLTAIGSLDPRVFALAFLLSALGTIFVPAIITSHSLKVGDMRIGLWKLIKINFVMRFYVLTLPHAITVGMRWHRYRGPQKGKGWQAAALIIFERIAQFTVVVLLAFVFLLMSSPDLPDVLRPLIPVSGLFVVLGLFAFMIFVSQPAFDLAYPLLVFISKRMPHAIAGRFNRLIGAVSDYQRIGKPQVAFVLLWTFAWHALFVLSAYVVCLGMGIAISFPDVGWMRSVVLLMTVLPITVGGIGVRAVGFAVLLHLYGVEQSLALAMPLVLLSIQLLLGMVGALLEAIRVIKKLWRNADVRG